MPHYLWEPAQWAIWKHTSSCLADPTTVKCLQLILLFLLAALVRWDGWLPPQAGMVEPGMQRRDRLFHVLLMQPEHRQPPQKRGGHSWNGCGQFLIPWKKRQASRRRGLVWWIMFLHNPFQLPHSSGCSARQKKHPWELALIFGGWQPLLPLSCLSFNTKHPWRGQICSTITSHFSYLPAEPSCHLCELLQADSLPQTNTIMESIPNLLLDMLSY